MSFKLGKLKPATVGFIAVGILVIIFLATSIYIVGQAEEAVITRFGRYHTTRGPGLQMKLPFGIDRNHTVNVRELQIEEFGFRTVTRGFTPTYTAQIAESTMLTGDLNIIDVEWVIQYRINDARAWLFNVQERERTIRDVSRSVINMLVGDRAIMDIMGRERREIEEVGRVLMNETFANYGSERFPGGLGIHVIAVRLQNINPPMGVRAAFDDVNIAIQDMNRLINEGQRVYNEEIPRARGEADRMIQVAHGYAAERVNMARGNVARFNAVFAEYLRAPEVTRQRLYFEMIEYVFRNREGVTLIDRNLSNFLPMMNLGGVIQQNPQGGR